MLGPDDLVAHAEPGVLHDNPDGRLRWLDAAGIDVQLVLPGGATAASTSVELAIAVGLMSSYNRYIAGYCEADPARLKAVIQLHGGEPSWSVEELHRWAGERSVAAFSLCLPPELAVDDPSLAPIWRASGELDLPLVHHAFPGNAPHFPGYRELWGRPRLARAAAHQWSAQRLLGALVQGGVFERNERLRVILGESGAGWLPAWLARVGGIDYARSGRILAALDPEEDEAIAESVIALLGDGVLVWQSRFPGRGTDGSAGDPLGWERIGADTKAKVMAGNAERCLRLL
jgi:predicted TIM-barrel fold metal-dependent hydrolase